MDIIIAGAGGVGRHLTERLVAENHNIVLIDKHADVLERLEGQFDIKTIQGNASVVETLKKAGVDTADLLIAATDSDEANLVSCILADSLSESIGKIARVKEIATDETGLSPRIREIFDHFIDPAQETVSYLLRLFEVPGACEVFDIADKRVRVIGITLRADSLVVNRRLRDLQGGHSDRSLLVVAIGRSEQLIVPSGEDVLRGGDTIYVVVEPVQTQKVFQLLGIAQAPIRSVMIWGGTSIGRKLANELSCRDIRVKLIESDTGLCEQLAEELKNVLVLNGEGTDPDLLFQEGIEDIDAFVGATDDEEDNIIAVLLAKRLGARTGAVVVNKTQYLNVATTIGIDIVANPRIEAASSILKFVRRSAISSVFATRDDTAEVLEIEAKENSKIVGRPLRDIKLPHGVIVAAIVDRDTVTIPGGDTIVVPNDHVICFANRAAVPRFEKFLETRFSFF